MTSKIFSPVTSEQWEKIKAEFSDKAGISITSDEGSASAHSVQFSWSYAGTALTVTISHVGFPTSMFADESKILDEFSSWIAGVE